MAPDKQKKLHAIIEQHRAMEGQWGKSDCFMMAVEAYKALTGKALLSKLRRYKTEAGGYRLFKKFGFTSVDDALASALPRCAPLQLQEGDLATVNRGGIISCGVIVSNTIAVKTLYEGNDGSAKSQLDFLPLSSVMHGYKVV